MVVAMRFSRTLVAVALFGIALIGAMTPAVAVQPDEVLSDPALEARARNLSKELRCMVCQNQSIDDSDAPLAKDLRVLVRERLKAGDSDERVMTYLVDRYGQFVLLRPQFSISTALLWLTPLAAFAIGAIALYLSMRRRRSTIPPPLPLDRDEENRLRQIVAADKS